MPAKPMKIYLVQHGDAVSKDVNPDRPLSERGRADVTRVGMFLKGKLTVTHIYHSGKTRARQTAEILARRIQDDASTEPIAGIAPNDAVAPFVAGMASWGGDVMVVGHLPFMEKLVTQLLMASAEGSVVHFQPGSMVCLETGESDGWQMVWMLRPDML